MGTRTVLLAGADDATTGAVTRRLRAEGVRVAVGDLADPGTAVEQAVAELGSLDALVCAVGSPAPAPFLGSDPALWYDDVLGCLTAPFRLVRAAVPALRTSGDGRVVLLGSGWLAADRAGSTAAGSVHGGVVALTKTLARDLGPVGITVNEIVTDPADPAAPDVVAGAVAYLCGPASGAVVGQLLTLGRGGTLRP